MAEPLKIGIVCYPTIGGSGILATRLGELLADAGHEVHFISYERPIQLRIDSPRIHFHPVTINTYALFKYPDYTLPLSVKIAEISKDYTLDILHVHYAVPHATAALLARQMMNGAPRPVIVTTLHGTDTSLMGKDPHYRPIIKHSIDQSDGVTTVSESLKLQTIDTFQVRHPIEVVPNFHDPIPASRTRAETRAELGVADGDILLLHMSNLRRIKRIGDILEALKALRNLPQTRLLILAGGHIGPLMEDIGRLGLEGRVVVREEIWDVADYIEACDLGVYASEQESFGLSILETLSCGRTVVATEAGGIPEVVRNDQTGFLVPIGQPAAIAAAVDRLIDDPDLRERAGRAAREDVGKRFSGARIRDHYLAYYRSLL